VHSLAPLGRGLAGWSVGGRSGGALTLGLPSDCRSRLACRNCIQHSAESLNYSTSLMVSTHTRSSCDCRQHCFCFCCCAMLWDVLSRHLLLLCIRDVMQSVSAKSREDEGPQTIKYVDMSKTSDSYDKVREWQETGKKRYP